MARRKKRILGLNSDFIEVESSTKKGVIIVIVFLIAIISLLSIFDLAGDFGRVVYKILKLIFGWGFWIFPIILLAAGYLNLSTAKYSFKATNVIGSILVVLGYSGFFHLTQEPDSFQQILKEGIGGGYIGFAISYPFFKIMGRLAGMATMIAFFVIGILLMFNTSLESLIAKVTFKNIRQNLSNFCSRKKIDTDDAGEDEQKEEVVADNEVELEFEKRELTGNDENITDENVYKDGKNEITVQKFTKKYSKIDLPLDLLNIVAGESSPRDVKMCQEIIRKTLNNFGIEVKMGEYFVGPTVTQYTFRPAEGVKLSRIVGLGNDLAMALAAHPIRIEAPIPGRALVGIEVPNKKIAVVSLRQVLESKEFKIRKSNLSIALGTDVAGKPWMADLEKLPHLLVAGATNSGKTVCLNSIILSLLYQNQPDELKLILVDPKRVELIGYNEIPHLLTPVIVDIKKMINALKWTISEMEKRFQILSNAGKRNIQVYNTTHPKDKLPYLVFVIDELADLMSIASAEVEAAVIRLAQMSRAVGIHLVLATQRPSVDIITGLIKANIPGRIAFAVASLTDSRTILDASGAEKLLGRGDMLYTAAELSKPKRLQGAYASDEDIENVVAYLREHSESDYEENVTERAPGTTCANVSGLAALPYFDYENSDEFLDEARELVIKAGKASSSYLQRKLRIGYARAARILDLLEEEGVIGPADGSKPREILVSSSKEVTDNGVIDSDNINEENIEENDYQEEENNSGSKDEEVIEN